MEEQPCMKMIFLQLSRNNTYVSIPEKLSETHLHAWLFSNPRGKILFHPKFMGQICNTPTGPLLVDWRTTMHGVDFAYWWSFRGGGSAINGATPSSLLR